MALYKTAAAAKVTGVFIPSSEILGTPETGQWCHYAIVVPPAMVWNGRTMTAGQAMAEKRQDYINVSRALGTFSYKTVIQALALLDADALHRSEKVRGPVQWLVDLHIETLRDRVARTTPYSRRAKSIDALIYGGDVARRPRQRNGS